MIKLNNKKGFTLIELMIVIAIIGILAAIAIPNFIAYRDKSYCSRAESDANTIGAAISDYFSIPTRTVMPTFTWLNLNAAAPGTVNVALSGNNTATVAPASGQAPDDITITVTDASGRCPDKYQQAMLYVVNQKDGWDGSDHHVKYMLND
jgi:prepilin-type N-terminal cleavage/methylation domain-containing protein